MKRLFLKALYLFVVTAMLCGCEFISSIENGGGEQETPDDLSEIYAYNNIESDKWDYLIAQSKDKMILVDDSEERINAFGVAEDAFVAIDINEVDGMLAIESEGTNIRVNRGELAMVVIYNVLGVSVREIYPYDNIGENETRASASNRSMLEVLTGELCNTILDAIGNMSNVSLGGIETGIKLMKYLYDTKDMNDNEIRDYIIDEGYNLISKDTLDKLFGWADTHEEENYQRPIFFVGIKTGDCIVDKNEAKCSIDGCLYVDGNGGEFDFDYGICCSQDSPDIHDIVMSKNVTSGLLSTIDVGLPAYLSFTSLSEGRYYYVAFVKDNITGNVMYADNICQFDIMYNPERDILIKFYHDTGGDNWTHNDNWCSDKPIEEWYGVHYCSSVDVRDGEDNVLFIEFEEPLLCISLKHNNLVGSGSLAGLSSLAKLNLGGNDKLHSLDVSNCNELRAVVYKGGNLVSLNASGCTKLVYVQCKDNQLTYLNCSGCAALEHLRCENNQLTQEITGIFAQIPYFDYDVRYEYWDAWVDGVRCYTDRGVGWWYPGEPQKGYHGK